LEGLGINLGYLLVQIANFAIIFVVILVWVVKPVLGLLEKRRTAIAQGLEDAQEAAEARENAEAEAARIISEAQLKSTEIVKEASGRAEVAVKQLHADAEKSAVDIRGGAKSDVEDERNRMLRELRGQVSALAIAAAHKLIGESLMQDTERQQALIDEFFSGIKGATVVVLDGTELSGEEVIVTSALPLSDQEQETIKKDLLSRSGGRVDEVVFTFDVDPSILGGLVIRVGDRVVDGSVANQLQEMSTSL
jgi:F-type H+-transporting ATPase subunit b